MIERHFNYTESSVAKFILDNWKDESKYFVKVFPKDYQRVLIETGEIEPESIEETKTLSKGKFVA